MQTSPSQKEMILAYLKQGRTLTPLDALHQFGCLRLGARIWDLKQEGVQIEMKLLETVSGKHVAEYRIPAQKMEPTTESLS